MSNVINTTRMKDKAWFEWCGGGGGMLTNFNILLGKRWESLGRFSSLHFHCLIESKRGRVAHLTLRAIQFYL